MKPHGYEMLVARQGNPLAPWTDGGFEKVLTEFSNIVRQARRLEVTEVVMRWTPDPKATV